MQKHFISGLTSQHTHCIEDPTIGGQIMHTSKVHFSEPSDNCSRHVHNENIVLTWLMHSEITLIITLVDGENGSFLFQVKHFHVNVLHHVEYVPCSAQGHTIHLPLGEIAWWLIYLKRNKPLLKCTAACCGFIGRCRPAQSLLISFPGSFYSKYQHPILNNDF